MKTVFLTLLKREFGAILLSPIAYVLFLCMAFIGGFTFMQSVYYILQGVQGFTVMQIFFYLFHFWIALLILVPVITMRLFSEEYKTGTIETLLTAPVDEWEVILAKFFAATGFYALLWSSTILYFLTYQALIQNQTPVVWGPLILAYVIVMLVGMFYIAIGLFASSLTRNQAISAIVAFTLIALLFFMGFFYHMTSDPFFREFFSYIFTIDHVRGFSEGILDTRPLVFYISGIVLFLFLTHRVVASKRLK